MNYSRLLLLTLVTFLAFRAQSQTDPVKDQMQIVLTKGTLTPRIIENGQSAKVWLNNEETPLKGDIIIQHNKTLLINDREISISNIKALTPKKLNKLIGGSALTLAGAGMIYKAVSLFNNDVDHPCFGGDCIIEGYLTAKLGLASSSIGLVLLASSSTKYDLTKWQINIEEKDSTKK